MLQRLIYPGGGTTGIDFGKNLISAYRYNEAGTGYVKLGAYDKGYFSHDGSGIFTCKKNCSVRVVGITGAVIGNSYASFNIKRDGDVIGSTQNGGGWRVIDLNLSAGMTLSMSAYAERSSGSAVLNVYLK